MIREVAHVLDAVPHDQLTIGWDIPSETVALERGRPWQQLPFDPTETAIVGDLSRVATAIPHDVPMGFHLCLGSMGNKHVLIPEDARNQVSLMNRLAAELPRPVGWLHAPVPRDADPQRYLAPYRELCLPESTALYPGVVDIADGLDATQLRISAAQPILPGFGVSTVRGIDGEFYSRADAIASSGGLGSAWTDSVSDDAVTAPARSRSAPVSTTMMRPQREPRRATLARRRLTELPSPLLVDTYRHRRRGRVDGD